MSYQIIDAGSSLSFPGPHPFTDAAVSEGLSCVFIGKEAAKTYAREAQRYAQSPFMAIELDNECLGVHIGEAENGPTNVVGFARFRLGDSDPSNLIELVKKPFTDPATVAAAKSAFEQAGLVVAVCNDFPGRIVNRLVRPYYNAALRRLDEGLASAADMDKTLRLGLGYPEGPIALLERSGLHHHYRVTQELYQALGQEPYAAARRAQIAWLQHTVGGDDAAA